MDETILTMNRNISSGIKYLIPFAICTVVQIVIFALNYEDIIDSFNSSNANGATMFMILIMIGFGSLTCLLIGVLLLIIGLIGRKRVNNFVNEHGVDEIMSELNHYLYVLGTDKKPITVITPHYIYEVGVGFITSTDVDLAYGYRYKSNSHIRIYKINGKSDSICRGIKLYGDEIKEVFAALYEINPDILIGYTARNLQTHRERVKEYKANNR